MLFPQALVSLDLGVWVIGGRLIAAAALVVMQTWVVRKTGSTAIAADRAHYITDIAVNAGVLLALVVTKLIGWERADPTFAPLVAGYLATAFGASTTREHDMRSHFRRFFLEVYGALTVNQGHEIGDAADTAVVTLLPRTVEVTGHLEPFGAHPLRSTRSI